MTSELHVDPRDAAKIVDRIVLDHRHAHFERQRDGLGHITPDHEIDRQEQAPRLAGDRIAVVDANFGIRVKRDKPMVRY